MCVISRLQHPDPTPGCGKAQPQHSPKNKLWPVQAGGAWTDTQQPHQGSGSCSVPAAELKHHPGINTKEDKSRKSPHSLHPNWQLPESPSDTTFSHNLNPLWLLQHCPMHQRPRNKHTDQENTFKNLYFHSQASSSNGEKGQRGYSLHIFCVLAKTHNNSLSEY